MTRGGYDALLKFLREKAVDVVELFVAIKGAKKAPPEITAILEAFRQATIQELWNSPDEIEEHYQADEAYQKLLRGEEGVNLLTISAALLPLNICRSGLNTALR
jgi:hypothetical protein